MNRSVDSDRIHFVRFCVGGLFFFALLGVLYASRSVLLPVMMALILMLITRPFYGLLHRLLKLPEVLASTIIVLCVTGTLVTGGYFLAEPASRYIDELGNKDVQKRLKRVFSPIQKIHSDIVNAAEKVDKIAEESNSNPEDQEKEEGEPPAESGEEPDKITAPMVRDPLSHQEPSGQHDKTSPSDKIQKETKKQIDPDQEPESEKAVRVEIKENSVGAFYIAIKDFGFYALSTLVLLFFLLAYGEEMSKRMGQARGTPELLLEIEKEVSGYLFTITAINSGLGAAIGIGLWLLGVPNPILWGVMAALLNFIPYAGALIGTVIVTLVCAMEFQTPGMTLIGGAIYLALSSLEGNLITPMLIGRRFEINPIIVFVWVLIWAAIWGLAGMLIGLPLLIILRVVCARVPSLERVGRVITIKT